MRRFGEFATKEAVRRSLRTPALQPGAPSPRYTFAVADHASAEVGPRSACVVTEYAPTEPQANRHAYTVTEHAPPERPSGDDFFDCPDDSANVWAAFARSPPSPCPGCGQEGVQGTPWNPCCKRMGTPQVICNACHTPTAASAYERTGCAQRVKLPPCGNDDETGIVHGEGHLVPTPAEVAMYDRHYHRVKAMRARQSANMMARRKGVLAVSSDGGGCADVSPVVQAAATADRPGGSPSPTAGGPRPTPE